MRGWTFRIAFLLPFLFLLVVALTSFFRTPVFYSFIMASYRVPESIPWVLMIFFTVYSSVVVSALATDSSSSEFRLDSLDSLRVRPWKNIEYAFGKLLGQFICFALMTICFTLFLLGIVFIRPGLFISGAGWFLYPLIIFLPTFFFIYGLSALISRVIRNQMFSLLIVTTVLVTSLAAANRYFHLFDIPASRLPLFLSRITAFSFPEATAAHRLLYLGLGMTMVLFSVLVFRRPPERRSISISVLALAIALGIISLGAGYQYSRSYTLGIDLRRDMRELSSTERPAQRIKAIEYELDVRQAGRGIDATARVVLENNSGTPCSRYLFVLNPGLKVSDVSDCSGRLEFDRKLHLLSVHPTRPLLPGMTDTILFSYRGVIDEAAMYSDIPEKIRCSDISVADLINRTEVLHAEALKLIRIRRDLAPQRYDYILLVPDAMWYPIPGLPYDPEFPLDDHRDFSRYRTRVVPGEGLSVVSQGEQRREQAGAFVFEPEYPLPGITLAIGRFNTRVLEVDSVEYYLHSTPGSESLVELIGSVRDTIPGLISEKRDLIEYSLGLDYPFARFSCLEVPVSFSPFNRPMRDSGFGYVQPEILLLHERGITTDQSMTPSWLASGSRNRRIDEEKAKEMRDFWLIRSASSFMHNLGEAERFNVSSMFFRQAVGIESSRYPHLGLLFDYFSGLGAVYRERGRSYFSGAVYSSNERASRFIHNGKFLNTVTDPENSSRMVSLVNAWASHQYYIIDANSESGAMSGFVRDLAKEYRFKSVKEDELLDAFHERFGFRLEPTLLDLEKPSIIPGYLISSYRCCKFIEDERERFRLGFDVSNLENAPGVIVIVGALKYSGSQFRRPKRKLKNPVLAVESFEPGESRRVEFEIDFKPISIWIHTKISRNVPARIVWGPNIDIRPSCTPRSADNRELRPSDFEDGSFVVDDIDPGFEVEGGSPGGFLYRLFPFMEDEREYANIRRIHNDPPAVWSRLIHMGYFGKYRRTARCIRAGDGKAKAVWRMEIQEPGSYDVFTFVFDHKRKITQRDRDKYRFDEVEHHYRIYHSDGSEDVVLKPDQCEDGWNLIGSYYFEKGEAVVELSDESPVLYVIADAVKWVKKD